ncbi:hypothetical protein BDR06DRAFT_954406 [Suillus hirtellus]|nr:hypothetical protein BDR06DRAFT_954406 [Suillus hirtellus]
MILLGIISSGVTFYAYMLTPNNICSDSNIICNSDYGVSINQGSFGFETGQCVFFKAMYPDILTDDWVAAGAIS